jgi:hypothetical protein
MADQGGRSRAAGSEVAIGRLGLSVPGVDRGTGQRLAERLAERLAQRIPPGLTGRFGRLEVVARPHGTSEEAVTEAVVEAVLRGLARGSRSA